MNISDGFGAAIGAFAQRSRLNMAQNIHSNRSFMTEKLITGDDLTCELRKILEESSKRFILAIDGRCASGKTTFARSLSALFGEYGPAVFSIDDFFLPFYERRDDWRHIPAGNIDLKRFEAEVLQKLRAGSNSIAYNEYNCKTGVFSRKIKDKIGSFAIIEGAYCVHPYLSSYYDKKVFLTADKRVREERIRKRNGEDGLRTFGKMWIPMEEHYFKVFRIEEKCDFIIQNNDFSGNLRS